MHHPSGTLTAPMIYSFMWLTIFGGAGIRTERLAAKEGLCCTSWNSTVLGWSNDQMVSNFIFHYYFAATISLHM